MAGRCRFRQPVEIRDGAFKKLFLWAVDMLKYQALGPDEEGSYAVVVVYPHDVKYGPQSGVYCVIESGATSDGATSLCKRLNEPPCERTLMLREKVRQSNASQIIRDISDEEKAKRGIK